MFLDEKELLQQAFDPLYVTEEEARAAFEKINRHLTLSMSPRRKLGQLSKRCTVKSMLPLPRERRVSIYLAYILCWSGLSNKLLNKRNTFRFLKNTSTYELRVVLVRFFNFPIFSSDGVASALENMEWPQFTFLGTASSSPSKYRSISAILVRLRCVTSLSL